MVLEFMALFHLEPMDSHIFVLDLALSLYHSNLVLKNVIRTEKSYFKKFVSQVAYNEDSLLVDSHFSVLKMVALFELDVPLTSFNLYVI